MGGLLGSSHCVGMCGAFALSVGNGAASLTSNVLRQLVYSGGRIFTYGVAGAIAGVAGWQLRSRFDSLLHVQSYLALLAGILLVFQGLWATGLISLPHGPVRKVTCLAASFFRPFMQGRAWPGYFLAGLFTGFLPCGLVYAYLALAVSAGSLWNGLAVMGVFGLGTVPIMVLVGGGGSLMQLATRRRLLRAAAWCIVLTGLLSIGRGLMFLSHAGPATDCPICQQESLSQAR